MEAFLLRQLRFCQLGGAWRTFWDASAFRLCFHGFGRVLELSASWSRWQLPLPRRQCFNCRAGEGNSLVLFCSYFKGKTLLTVHGTIWAPFSWLYPIHPCTPWTHHEPWPGRPTSMLACRSGQWHSSTCPFESWYRCYTIKFDLDFLRYLIQRTCERTSSRSACKLRCSSPGFQFKTCSVYHQRLFHFLAAGTFEQSDCFHHWQGNHWSVDGIFCRLCFAIGACLPKHLPCWRPETALNYTVLSLGFGHLRYLSFNWANYHVIDLFDLLFISYGFWRAIASRFHLAPHRIHALPARRDPQARVHTSYN